MINGIADPRGVDADPRGLVVMLCVAQAAMGIPSDRRFWAIATKRLRHLFLHLPMQSGYFKRRRRLAETLGRLTAVARSSPPGVPPMPRYCSVLPRELFVQGSVWYLGQGSASHIALLAKRAEE